MKNLYLRFCIVILCLYSHSAFSQISVVSSNGYAVNITIRPVAIVPGSSSCQYGYNYNVRLQYSITYSGSNQPSSLYTLQGTVGCGANTHFYDLPNGQGSGMVVSQSNVWRGNSDCNTATVNTLGCNTATIEIEGPGISHRFVSFTVTANPLPVKLTAFTATPLNNRVQLKWNTASESNSDYFQVEKRKTGSTNWQTVARVAAKGLSNASTDYTASDDNPENGNTEYRLAMVDVDGHIEYSPVQLVNFNGKTGSISVYPVPAVNRVIHFTGLGNRPSDYSFSMNSVSGAVLFTRNLTSASAELPELKKGLYLIRLTNRVTGETTSLRYMQ